MKQNKKIIDLDMLLNGLKPSTPSFKNEDINPGK